MCIRDRDKSIPEHTETIPEECQEYQKNVERHQRIQDNTTIAILAQGLDRRATNMNNSEYWLNVYVMLSRIFKKNQQKEQQKEQQQTTQNSNSSRLAAKNTDHRCSKIRVLDRWEPSPVRSAPRHQRMPKVHVPQVQEAAATTDTVYQESG